MSLKDVKTTCLGKLKGIILVGSLFMLLDARQMLLINLIKQSVETKLNLVYYQITPFSLQNEYCNLSLWISFCKDNVILCVVYAVFFLSVMASKFI